MLVLPGEDAGLGHGAQRDGRAGDVVDQVDEVAGQAGDGTVGEAAHAVPAGEVVGAEGTRRNVHEKLLPVHVLRVGLGQAGIPVGPGAVADLLDARHLAQHAGLEELAAAGARRVAAHLGSDLADDLGGLHRVARPLELLHVHGQGLFAVDVLTGLGRGLQVRGVLVVAGGDHHGVDVVQGQQVAVRDERPGGPAVPLLALLGAGLAARAPGIGHRGDFEVLLLGELVNAGHVGPQAPLAAADDADRDAVVGPNNAGVAGGRNGQSGRADGGRLEELAARWSVLHGEVLQHEASGRPARRQRQR